MPAGDRARIPTTKLVERAGSDDYSTNSEPGGPEVSRKVIPTSAASGAITLRVRGFLFSNRDELCATKRAGASELGQVKSAFEQDDAGVLARGERDECLSRLGARGPPGRDCRPVLSLRAWAVRVLVSGAS